MNQKFFALGTYAAFALTAPAWAHHSHANYVSVAELDLSGTVKDVQWGNPHIWVYMIVPDASGQPKTWTLEGGSPIQLSRKGWQSDSIKTGDSLSVRCRASKDGSEGCLLGFVTKINGVEPKGNVPGQIGKEFD